MAPDGPLITAIPASWPPRAPPPSPAPPPMTAIPAPPRPPPRPTFILKHKMYLVELILILSKNDTRKNLFICECKYEKKMKVTSKNEKNYVTVI
ncbi:hypothetical protein ALC57_16670 [Trachymyrmex cornetzi]|uniref:Uncharacterized protein n=1 Tax=Trachymyrmex cornetzi TaxID=471704 RepID=A0A195DE55_9HYME|nr:hypothetical protein ALC57_16670 [Trachymyrmex cornetzi]